MARDRQNVSGTGLAFGLCAKRTRSVRGIPRALAQCCFGGIQRAVDVSRSMGSPRVIDGSGDGGFWAVDGGRLEWTGVRRKANKVNGRSLNGSHERCRPGALLVFLIPG